MVRRKDRPRRAWFHNGFRDNVVLIYLMFAFLLCGETCAQTFSGVLQNLDLSSAQDWSRCWAEPFNLGLVTNISSLFSHQCNKGRLILGCRRVGDIPLYVAASGDRSQVLTNTGASNLPNVANNVSWYFSEGWSIGFAGNGDVINRISCDYDFYGKQENPQLRFCMQTKGGMIENGFRCGNQTFLGGDPTWERVIYHADPVTSTPTLLPTSSSPTATPSRNPVTSRPSMSPSTSSPSLAPVLSSPSNAPLTSLPTFSPTSSPSRRKTHSPSLAPSSSPTRPVTLIPSSHPIQNTTRRPSASPISNLTMTTTPSSNPSASPSSRRSVAPSSAPTSSGPSATPTKAPSRNPVTSRPSSSPSRKPSASPTSSSPSRAPSSGPTRKPTKMPRTARPTHSPTTPTTFNPTQSPTNIPSASPTHTDQFFSGVKTDVNLTHYTQWQLCWNESYEASFQTSADKLLNTLCTKKRLMVACGRVDTPLFASIAAQAPRDAVTNFTVMNFDVNDTAIAPNVTVANGVSWYWNTNHSFGFAPEGDDIFLGECDFLDGTDRLCVHFQNSFVYYGYRCGNALRDVAAANYTRMILQTDDDHNNF